MLVAKVRRTAMGVYFKQIAWSLKVPELRNNLPKNLKTGKWNLSLHDIKKKKIISLLHHTLHSPLGINQYQITINRKLQNPLIKRKSLQLQEDLLRNF